MLLQKDAHNFMDVFLEIEHAFHREMLVVGQFIVLLVDDTDGDYTLAS
jgi:hypothetical protein